MKYRFEMPTVCAWGQRLASSLDEQDRFVLRLVCCALPEPGAVSEEELREILGENFSKFESSTDAKLRAAGILTGLPITVKTALTGNRMMVGPIAEGETPEMAAGRMAAMLGHKAECHAFVMHREPIRARNAQFPVIVGTVWCGAEVVG